MKKTGLLVLVLAVGAFGQQNDQLAAAAPVSAAVSADQPSTVETNANYPHVQLATPTYADLYCAGFINKQVLPNDKYVGGGLHTPNTTKYVKGDIVYLSGQGYEPGARYTVLRELYDVNRFETYPREHEIIKATGQPYEEVGRIRVLDTRNKMAIAQVEYSCDTILPGDTLTAFVEKTPIEAHPPVKFDRFAPPSGRLSGRIVMAKDFDSIVGMGMKVYMNVGANQGVKVGDYFRAMRSYDADRHNPVDQLSFDAPLGEDSQAKQPSYKHEGLLSGWGKAKGPVIDESRFPHRGVGEVVVIGVTPTTSTGMVTFALEDIHTGDGVELVNEQ